MHAGRERKGSLPSLCDVYLTCMYMRGNDPSLAPDAHRQQQLPTLWRTCCAGSSILTNKPRTYLLSANTTTTWELKFKRAAQAPPARVSLNAVSVTCTARHRVIKRMKVLKKWKFPILPSKSNIFYLSPYAQCNQHRLFLPKRGMTTEKPSDQYSYMYTVTCGFRRFFLAFCRIDLCRVKLFKVPMRNVTTFVLRVVCTGFAQNSHIVLLIRIS